MAQHSLVIHSRPTAGRLKFQFSPDARRSRAYPLDLEDPEMGYVEEQQEQQQQQHYQKGGGGAGGGAGGGGGVGAAGEYSV